MGLVLKIEPMGLHGTIPTSSQVPSPKVWTWTQPKERLGELEPTLELVRMSYVLFIL